jgi:hypothetical protein
LKSGCDGEARKCAGVAPKLCWKGTTKTARSVEVRDARHGQMQHSAISKYLEYTREKQPLSRKLEIKPVQGIIIQACQRNEGSSCDRGSETSSVLLIEKNGDDGCHHEGEARLGSGRVVVVEKERDAENKASRKPRSYNFHLKPWRKETIMIGQWTSSSWRNADSPAYLLQASS